ncbi:MAG: MGMT family protein, partial [Bacteroidota bacterium]
RAVGAANGRNLLALVVPCHRVIGSSGELIGYAFGLDIKRSLLELEQGNGGMIPQAQRSLQFMA